SAIPIPNRRPGGVSAATGAVTFATRRIAFTSRKNTAAIGRASSTPSTIRSRTRFMSHLGGSGALPCTHTVVRTMRRCGIRGQGRPCLARRVADVTCLGGRRPVPSPPHFPRIPLIMAGPPEPDPGGRPDSGALMNLHEYQGKDLFARYGIPVLPGQVAATPEEARDVAVSLGG